MTIIRNALWRPFVATAFVAAAGGAAAQNVDIYTAWYGQTCGAQHGNVTAHVKGRCDGRAQCDYAVDVRAMGDPSPGCAKNFIVLYGCRGQAGARLAQLPAEADGRTLAISCTAPATSSAAPATTAGNPNQAGPPRPANLPVQR
jgi:hypothetical protein